jgi:hypothetical protein
MSVCANPPTEAKDEIRRYLHDFIAARWLDRQAAWAYEFVNGSTIHLQARTEPATVSRKARRISSS